MPAHCSPRGWGPLVPPARAAILGLAVWVIPPAVIGVELEVADNQDVQVITADGVSLTGRYHPSNPPSDLGILFVHGFTADYRTQPIPHLASEAADRGFSTLSLNMRDHGCCVHTTLFEDGLLDIDAGVQFLQEAGATRIVLLGHSLGGNRIAYYQAQVQHPSVEGLVLLASVGNAYERGLELGGERAQAVLAEADRRVAEGDRTEELLVTPLGRMGLHLFTAPSLLSYGGPDTNSDHLRWLPHIPLPLLFVHGTADTLAPLEQSELALEAAVASPQADLVVVEGADHSFSSHADLLVELLYGWLTQVLGAPQNLACSAGCLRV